MNVRHIGARAFVALALLAATVHAAPMNLAWSPVTMEARHHTCEGDTLLASPVDVYGVFARTASAFYMAHRDSMQDNRSPFFAAHWAQVKAEAEPRLLLVVAGTSASVDVDTLTWLDVRARKAWSAWACPSNMVRGR